jgi:hypothetical protein
MDLEFLGNGLVAPALAVGQQHDARSPSDLLLGTMSGDQFFQKLALVGKQVDAVSGLCWHVRTLAEIFFSRLQQLPHVVNTILEQPY